jgi:hypothetical protein
MQVKDFIFQPLNQRRKENFVRSYLTVLECMLKSEL